MFEKIRRYYIKNSDDKISHFIIFFLFAIVVIPFFYMVIHIIIYGVPDRGKCLKSTLKTSGYSTYPVCTKWEYPDRRPKKSLEKPMQEKKVK